MHQYWVSTNPVHTKADVLKLIAKGTKVKKN